LVDVAPNGLVGFEVRSGEMGFLLSRILELVVFEVNRHDLYGGEAERSDKKTHRQGLQTANNKLAMASGELHEQYS
jgi:hypothetical protein